MKAWQQQFNHEQRTRDDRFGLEKGIPDDDDEEPERETRYAFETRPALLGAIDARLQGLGDEIVVVSKSSKPSRHRSLDLNSVTDEDNLRTSFNLAMTTVIYADHHPLHRPATASNEPDDYNEELLLNTSKLGALLTVARVKGPAYLDKTQELMRKRMANTVHSPHQATPSEAQPRKTVQPVEPPSPQTKPVHFAHRNRPKSAHSRGSSNHTSVLQVLTGDNVADDMGAQPAPREEVQPEPSPTADRLIQAIALELATESPEKPPSPIGTARDTISEGNTPSISGVSQMSFVKQAKAIPPPTFVSVCLPSVPAAQPSNHAHILGNLDLGPRAHLKLSPASASSLPGGGIERQRSGPGIANGEAFEPGDPSATPSSAALPPTLAQQVCDMLHQDEPVPTLVLPDDILARKQSQSKRAQSAGGSRPRSRVGSSGTRDLPTRERTSKLVHKTILDFPAVPIPPARREAPSQLGFSPRLRSQGFPFPAGFKPQVSPRSTAVDASPKQPRPSSSRPTTVDAFGWPGAQNGEDDRDLRANGGGGRASPVEERKQSSEDPDQSKHRVLYLAHKIVQEMELPPHTSPSPASKGLDVPVSIVSAPEHLQRLIEEERERQRQRSIPKGGIIVNEGTGEGKGVDLALPLDLVRAMDKQLQRYTELQRRSPSPPPHSPLPTETSPDRSLEENQHRGSRQTQEGDAQMTAHQESTSPMEDDQAFGKELVLRWRYFLDHKGDPPTATATTASNQPVDAPSSSAKVKPNIQPIALDRAIGNQALPPARTSSRSSSRPSSSRRLETKVLQLDATAIAELFQAPSQAMDNSWFDEDYMHVNTVLAEYAAWRGNSQDRVVRLNPKVMSRRIGRLASPPPPSSPSAKRQQIASAGRSRAAVEREKKGERDGAKANHVEEGMTTMEGDGLTMHARPVSIQSRRPVRMDTREGRK